MSHHKRVSVCIPAYNAAGHIGHTLQSVLDSTYRNLEIIVSDDASSDGTADIVSTFRDERIRFFRNERNVGPVKNWNLAIKPATGDYVGLLNHDDLYDPFWVTLAVHVLAKYPHVGWVAAAYRVIDRTGQLLYVRSRFPETRVYSPAETFPRLALLYGLGPGYIARRQALEAIGYYNEDAGPGADNELFLRLAARYPLYYSTYPHTVSRLHPGNLTHRWTIVQQAEESLAMLDRVFGDPALPEHLRQYRDRCFSSLYVRMLRGREIALQAGQHDIAERLLELLYANGYKG